MFPFQSDGAREMIKLEKLVDKVNNNEADNKSEKSELAGQQHFKLGAPVIPRAGIREPKFEIKKDEPLSAKEMVDKITSKS